MSGRRGAAVVTGCSSGFGWSTAVALSAKGWAVVATVRDPAAVGSVGDEMRRVLPPDAALVVEQLDVTDAAAAHELVARIMCRGSIEVLVNNAGVGFAGPIETIDMATAQAVMETNFWGPMRLCREVLPAMRERRRGVIVNVGSLAAQVPAAMYNGVYTASKRAIAALSESLAQEVAPFGVRVVCVEPGFFTTSIMENAARAHDDAAGTPYEQDAGWFRRFMQQTVAGGGDPALVVDAIVAAVEDDSTPLHVLVGDDADLYVSTYRDAGTFEAWLGIALPVVESVVGPRPSPS